MSSKLQETPYPQWEVSLGISTQSSGVDGVRRIHQVKAEVATKQIHDISSEARRGDCTRIQGNLSQVGTEGGELMYTHVSSIKWTYMFEQAAWASGCQIGSA
jgi:hypothetical protein